MNVKESRLSSPQLKNLQVAQAKGEKNTGGLPARKDKIGTHQKAARVKKHNIRK